MKKLLLTFLVGILSTINVMAAAKTVSDLAPITGDYTMIFENITTKGTVKPTAGNLYFDNHLLTPVSNTVATNKGKSTIGDTEYLNCLRLKNAQDYIVFKVGGPCKIKFYTYKDSSRGVGLAASATTTYIATETNSNVFEYDLTATELAKYTNNVIYAMGNGGDFYIAGIEFIFEAASYEVTYQNDGNGTLTGATTAKAGSKVDVTATPNSGYRFDYITVNNTKQKNGATSFTMPSENTTVKAFFAKAINVAGVSMNKTTLDMMLYSQTTLSATVNPADATNQNITWSSDNPDVATVSNGVVYAKSVGTANITVTTEDGNKTATCAVTVSALPGEVLFSSTPVSGKNMNVVHKAAAAEVTDEYATTTGGKVYLYNGHASNDADMTYAGQFNLGGSGASYVHIELNKSLKAGDVISMVDYYGVGVTTANAFYISTSTTKGSTGYAFPYVVTESSPLNGKKDLYIWKYGLSAFKTISVHGEIARVIEVSNNTVSVSNDNTTTEIDITGEDLLGTTLSATLSPEVEGLSVVLDNDAIADGAITAKATITYAPTANAKGSTTLKLSDGTTTKEVKVSYSAKLTDVEFAHVSEATTWDWKKLHDAIGVDEIKYTDATNIKKTDEIVLANEPLIFPVSSSVFNAEALKVTTEYAMRVQSSTYFMQGASAKFYAEQPGTVKVKFSDTGSRADATYDRCLAVNGVEMNVATHTATPVESGAIAIPAGEVELTGYYVDKEARNSTGTQYLRIYSIEYTPAVAASTITLNASGYATYSSSSDVRINGAQAYKAAVNDDKLVLTEVEGNYIPAGTGVILYGEPSATVEIYTSANAPAITGNALKATTLADGTLATLESCLVLSGKELVRYTGAAFAANKAYLPYDFGGSAKGLTIVFDDEEATAINGVAEAAPVAVKKFFKNGQLLIQTAKGTVNAVGVQVK